MPRLSKAEQEAEATARRDAGIDPGESAMVQPVVDDGQAGDAGADAPGKAKTAEPPADATPPAPPVKSRFDDKRADIIARFRTERTAQIDEQRDDISEFTRSGMPPEFDQPRTAAPAEPQPEEQEEQEEQPQPEAAAEPAAPAPQKIKLKVRGQDLEVPLEELIAKAQIAYAADNYLDEAKGKLKEVDTLLRQTRDQAPRAGRDGAHPAAPKSAQPAEPDQPEGGEPQHPEDPIAKLIQTIQFGDPAEAGALLETTLQQKAEHVVETKLEASRLKDEGARTNKVLEDFKALHPELAKDPMANAAIESRVLNLQLEDIVALGVDPNLIPTSNGVVGPADIAVAHRWYRANGYKVRSPKEMLEQSLEDFIVWKNGKDGKEKSGEKPADPAQPRVDVTIDRAARRQAIPQQPSRTAMPRQDATRQPAQQPRDRSSIVADMAARRNTPRGKVAV